MTFHRQVLRQLRLRDVIENALFDLFPAHGDGIRSNAIGQSWFALARFVFEMVGQTDVVLQNDELPVADNARRLRYIAISAERSTRLPHESKVQNRGKSARPRKLFLQPRRRTSMMRDIFAV